MSRAKALIVRLPDGSVELRDWPVWAAQLLDEVVTLADPTTPRGPARERLFPVAIDDDTHSEEWRKNMHPELFALFAASHAVVKADLTAADRGPRGRMRCLVIPAAHVPAWIAALQTARLHLAAAFDIGADAMQAPLASLSDEARGVVLRIDLLAEVQVHLLRGDGDSRG
ncbi:MAG: DUF2017 family protein [Planctomycetes bacterium]|nr:DUF2017 family protein [Planctomycetota bacterium]